ncbi:MAG: hypothetical protein ACE5SW_10895, partial [Nitrososphaeraceae archaeon]
TGLMNSYLAFAQDDMMGNDTGMMGNDTGMMNATLAFAQGTNGTMTNMTSNEEKEKHDEASAKGINVRDSVTVLLQDIIIPGEDFIHLYDTTPYEILNGHVAVKLPCDDESISPIQVLIGSAPELSPANLENVTGLSNPGDLCLYHADLGPGGNVTTITDIALMNPTEEDIEFPVTSSVVIGVNKIAKGEHHAEESGNSEEAAVEVETGHSE